MNDYERDCVLMFDEMAIKKYIVYDKNMDNLLGIQDHGEGERILVPASEALVFMVRGLNTNWIQPYSFYFSQASTKSQDLRSILLDNIDRLCKIGLKVRIVICDQSFTNQGLYRMLGVTIEEPYIHRNSRKIYFSFDSPHVIKNIRNHLKKHGYFIEGNHVLWQHIVDFYSKDISSEQRLAPKLSKFHIEIPDLSKMKVKLATQLLSKLVASGIKTLIDLPEGNDRKMTEDARPTSDFLLEMDSIFDLLNTSSRHVPGKPLKSANNYYKNLEKLRSYRKWVSEWLMSDGTKIVDSVKGLQLTLHSLELLLSDLHNDGYGYVFTRRIQQDILEHYFSYHRGRNGFCKNPTAKQFAESFKYLLICDLLGSSSGTNCEKSEKTDLVSQNCHRFKKILQFRRKSVTQPGTSVRTTQQTSASSSSEFECSDDEYENDLQIQNYQGFDFFDLTDSHEIDLKDDNVTVYMANWCVKRVIKKLMKLKNSKSCSSCRELLETLSDRQSNELDMTEQLTKNKARFGDFSTLSGQIPQILYGHLVKEQVKKVFIKINENFRSAMKFYMNPQGENISKNVMIWLMRD